MANGIRLSLTDFGFSILGAPGAFCFSPFPKRCDGKLLKDGSGCGTPAEKIKNAKDNLSGRDMEDSPETALTTLRTTRPLSYESWRYWATSSPLLRQFKTRIFDVGGLVHPTALFSGLGPDLADRLPEAERAIGDRDLGRNRQTPALQIEQQGAPVVSALARAVGEAEQLLLALRRGADDDQDALRLVLQTRLQVDAVGPDVDVALGRQVALAPALVFVDPDLLQSRDGRGRQARSILAEQGGQRLLEVAGRDAFQIEDRDQRIEALRAPGVGRQDCRREADARRIVGAGLPVAHARLAHGDRPDAGHDLALGQMAVTHDASATIVGLQIGGRWPETPTLPPRPPGSKARARHRAGLRSAGPSNSLAESV